MLLADRQTFWAYSGIAVQFYSPFVSHQNAMTYFKGLTYKQWTDTFKHVSFGPFLSYDEKGEKKKLWMQWITN